MADTLGKQVGVIHHQDGLTPQQRASINQEYIDKGYLLDFLPGCDETWVGIYEKPTTKAPTTVKTA